MANDPNMNRIDQAKLAPALRRIRARAEKLHQNTPGPLHFDWPGLKELREHGRP